MTNFVSISDARISMNVEKINVRKSWIAKTEKRFHLTSSLKLKLRVKEIFELFEERKNIFFTR